MAAEMSLSDLTAALVAELSKSAAEADRRQREEYLALATEFGVSLERYCERAVGLTPDERATILQQNIDALLQLPPIEPPPGRGRAVRDPLVILLDDTAKRRLVDAFPSAAPAIEATTDANRPWRVRRDAVEKLITERLRDDATSRHRAGVAALNAGIPRAQIQGGTLTARIHLRQENGVFTAKLATEPAEPASTISVQFGVGAFAAP
ncbi:MAG: hypothetical protein QOF63_3370 [Thermoanaerobaculia bacterium]|jgi:hypothetical protein|nr:hypothetical protein [Thermoanaerobaculia bacterium]